MTYTTNSTGTYSWTTSSTSTSNSTRAWNWTPIGGWATYSAPPPKKKEIVISEEDFLNVLEGDND